MLVLFGAIFCCHFAASAEVERFPQAVIAADHPLASRAGIEVLKKGGNVVDAAVATSFALSVVRPASCGIGGGGFMLIWNAETQKAIAIDYRERAPAAANRDMFVNARQVANSDEPSRVGSLAAAVPGTVAGLCYVQREYGRLDLRSVMLPALRLARDGVEIDEHDRAVQSAMFKMFKEHPDRRERYPLLFRKYLNNGELWKPGDRWASPQLRALELIAEQGSAAFYRGPIAEAIVAEMRRTGGIVTADDLKSMQPVARTPLIGNFDDATIIAMPSPSSGGVALLESLNIIAEWEKLHPTKRLAGEMLDAPSAQHVLVETLKFAFADRAAHLGDADFVKIPMERLTSAKHAASIAARIDLDRTLETLEYGRATLPDDGGTSHFSVIDAAGNAVACTETINLAFGSFVVVPEFGIVLNNEMDDFAAEPGKPNAFGLMQSEANAIAPGKKPLSSMCPTIVVRDGKAAYALGASGGPRIISSTLQVLLRMMRQGMPPDAAVSAPRLHHQWLPDLLEIDPPILGKLRPELERRGHKTKVLESPSATQAVSRDSHGVQGGSDPRKHGQPAGY